MKIMTDGCLLKKESFQTRPEIPAKPPLDGKIHGLKNAEFFLDISRTHFFILVTNTSLREVPSVLVAGCGIT